MNEYLRKFIMDTVKKMINKNVDEWQVRQYALGWYADYNLLTQEDLVEIETLYAEKEAQRLAELEALKEEIPVEEAIEEPIASEEITGKVEEAPNEGIVE